MGDHGAYPDISISGYGVFEQHCAYINHVPQPVFLNTDDLLPCSRNPSSRLVGSFSSQFQRVTQIRLNLYGIELNSFCPSKNCCTCNEPHL